MSTLLKRLRDSEIQKSSRRTEELRPGKGDDEFSYLPDAIIANRSDYRYDYLVAIQSDFEDGKAVTILGDFRNTYSAKEAAKKDATEYFSRLREDLVPRTYWMYQFEKSGKNDFVYIKPALIHRAKPPKPPKKESTRP